MKFLVMLSVVTLVFGQQQVKYNTTNYTEPTTNVKIFKKYTNITFIPQGATDNTWVDYWMDGNYSTLIRSDKQTYFELQMTLHVPNFT